jgi:phosphate transport system substrate-binding protein
MSIFHRSTSAIALLLLSFSVSGQTGELFARAERKEVQSSSSNHSPVTQKVVVVTGARFSYKLVQKWIDDYYKVNPSVQILIESRGSADPAKFDVLAEVYEQDAEVKKSREYINVGRYAILPVATENSAFAKIYAEKGLNTELINQLFFHDIFADKENQKNVKAPFTVYTRLQKAGAPIVFTKYFGYEQKDIKGKAIAGSDEHLLKALVMSRKTSREKQLQDRMNTF